MSKPHVKLKGELAALKHRRIVDAARDLFHAQGYNATSFDVLARKLGVTKPMLYGAFKSKGDLLHELCSTLFATALEIVRDAKGAEGSAGRKLERLIVELTLLMCRARQDMAIYLSEETMLRPHERSEIGRLRNTIHAMIVDLIAHGHATREFRTADPRLAALAVTGMVTWVYNWYRPDGRLSPEAIAARLGRYGLLMVGSEEAGDPVPRSASDRSGMTSGVAPYPAPATGSGAIKASPEGRAENPSRKLIVDAATSLFSRNGYERTTLDALAKHIGIAKPLIYEFFDSKQQLLAEICQHSAELALDAIEQSYALQGDPTEMLRGAVDRFLSIQIAQQPNITIFRRERHHLPPDVVQRMRELNSAFDQILRTILAEGVAKGEFAIDDIGAAALAIAGVVGWTHSWFNARSPEQERAIRHGMADLALRIARPD